LKKILLFEPWHLGDVAVAMSVCRPFAGQGTSFALACNPKWQSWALGTGIISEAIPVSAPWTGRHKREKYNPFNYKVSKIREFRSRVLAYKPDLILDLRGDIRANIFLTLLFGKHCEVRSAKNQSCRNVYNRGELIQSVLGYPSVQYRFMSNQTDRKKAVTLFFGASDRNRIVPTEASFKVLTALHKEGYELNLILQPSDDRETITHLKQSLGLQRLNILEGSLTEISSFIKETAIVVSTDSGWLHIAHFYGKPTIGLFGFDTMKNWLPPGSSYITAKELYPDHFRYKRKYQKLQPLETIQAGEVVRLVQQLESQINISISALNAGTEA
jgi:ADP-heptose:LPS heptosyltransferase